MTEISEQQSRPTIIWSVFLAIVAIHAGAIYGLYLVIMSDTHSNTIIWFFVIHYLTAPGVTAGAHRLWSHRSYKAKWPLRLILMVSQTLALQRDIYDWALDHRVHHRYSETDSDPHNAKRGFFFAHIGWVFTEKHPKVVEKAKQVDVSDLLADPIVMFQRKFYVPLVIVIWGLIPTLVPCYYWNEKLVNSFSANLLRYVYMLHCAFFVNSAAHLWGARPYDQNISPADNRVVTYLTVGEGYHNYHHVFPYDYSTGEYSWQQNFNCTTFFIDFFAKIGWAYDRKKPSGKTIEEKRKTHGENYFRDANTITSDSSSSSNSNSNCSKIAIIGDYLMAIAFQNCIVWSLFGLRLLVKCF